MRLKDQVCSFEQSNELAAYIKLNTLWSWVILDGDDPDSARLILTEKSDLEDEECIIIPAPTTAELGILLLCRHYLVDWTGGKTFIRSRKSNMIEHVIKKHPWPKTEAQSRADAVIWLIKKGCINVEDLKL